MKKPSHFLIVGQGLAGTVLAWSLIQRGINVTVVDDSHATSSSRVAAGMWNPIVFRKVTKSWKADTLLPVADQTYRAMQGDANWFHSQKVVRLFPTADMQADFVNRLQDEAFENYLSDERCEEADAFSFNHDYGIVKGSGWLDVNALLDSYAQRWSEEGILFQEAFNESDLTLKDDKAIWKGKSFDQVVFCRGYQDKKSPWWEHLPIRYTKGEVLTLRIKDLNLSHTFNNSKYLLPIGQDLFRLGATYAWETEDTTTTEEGAQELLLKLKAMLPDKTIEVLEHKAGIRPTVRDRRPLIGRHPQHNQLAIMNGLGTKGVMIAPWLAEHLADHLLNDEALETEVDIARWEGNTKS